MARFARRMTGFHSLSLHGMSLNRYEKCFCRLRFLSESSEEEGIGRGEGRRREGNGKNKSPYICLVQLTRSSPRAGPVLFMWKEAQTELFMQFKVPWELVPTSASSLPVRLDLLPCAKCYLYV